ncbi:MAG: molybdopterin oxidoreductase family protein [Rhodovarius sp.]|nr:molybdopterin oxidoreductase family protein [Rhodovarius sp.]MCX7932223.1 molybdopterin oxidoreductase family protein [Rhodovarius sp.]MDW8314697.1 molybdopterin oxidoreductase family protein [Rhodovarius sp.]
MPDGSATDRIAYSAPIGDEVKTTTCYMCACRCGIRVHLKDGRVRYIEGNPDHPVNRGVLCGKGSAGIMTHYAPARLTAPLLRVGPRGSGEFREISWEEAMETATSWLREVRERDPRRLAFFTGRDQSQSLTGFWAAQFGTPNFAAHGGFCSVNMAAGGLYTVGGSFWEFGEPDWEHARYFMMFGVAEDHDSNPMKLGIARLKARGAKVVSVNPVRTGYSAVADEWVGIRPGTDGLFIMALIHELLREGRVDDQFLIRYTNAPWLVVQNAGGADHGLFARDDQGRPLAFDRARGAIAADAADLSPLLVGEVTLPDGRRARPVFELMAARYLDPAYAPEAVADRCGIPAHRIRRLAREMASIAFDQPVELPIPWTDVWGRRHPTMLGRPVAFHAMRGISAHSNGFHTCRALHLLQMLLGAVDTPGSWRYKSPFPRPIPPGPGPAGKGSRPNTPLSGNILAFPQGPEDLLVEPDGTPIRIDHAFSWEAPLALHGMMHSVIGNAARGDPYRIEVLFLFMANMAWNSAMNPLETIRCLTARDASGEYVIPRVIYSDAYFSETVPYADLILPDTTYLERWDCISLLDRPIGSAHGPADAIRQPVVKPDRDVRPFQEVLIELGARLGLPAFVKEDGSPRYRDYADYMVHHERAPGIGPLAGWRGADGTKHGVGEPNPDQLRRYIENGCFWRHHLAPEESYFKHANRLYLENAKAMGLLGKAEQIVLQIYSEPLQKFRLAAEGHGPIQPPDHLRARLIAYCDPLPIWYEPLEQAAQGEGLQAYPFSAVTQRPMAMYHSWGSMNAWLRQIHGANKLYLSRARAEAMGIAADDWVWVESPHGRVKAQVALMEGVQPDTVWTWNAIGKRAGAWALTPDAPEATRGFLLNHVISEWLPAQAGPRLANADPITGQAAWYDLRVRIVACAPEEAGATEPRPEPLSPPPGLPPRPSILRYNAGQPR